MGISLLLWERTFKLTPWIYALLFANSVLNHNLFFHPAHYDIQNHVGYKRKRRVYRRPRFVGNPAFGGRGPPYVVSGYKIFDSTLGYPGEGWAKLSFATWNTRSLTYERFQYCNSLRYDILAITELWRNQAKYQTRSKKFIVSEPKIIPEGPKQGEIHYPDDRAAGVGLLLSDRISKKVVVFG